jgi:hypothetical protein
LKTEPVFKNNSTKSINQSTNTTTIHDMNAEELSLPEEKAGEAQDV